MRIFDIHFFFWISSIPKTFALNNVKDVAIHVSMIIYLLMQGQAEGVWSLLSADGRTGSNLVWRLFWIH